VRSYWTSKDCVVAEKQDAEGSVIEGGDLEMTFDHMLSVVLLVRRVKP
jgi:hypothetical protein